MLAVTPIDKGIQYFDTLLYSSIDIIAYIYIILLSVLPFEEFCRYTPL